MIIGLTGKNGAGKGVVAEYLQSLGFEYYSLSDVIRSELRAQNVPITREALIQKGRELRETFGPSVLADLILKKIVHAKPVIVDSVRNPFEVKALRVRPDFILIAVDADQYLRFERCKSRGRENDPQDFDEFVRLENEELNNPEPSAQQLLATASLADYVVMNDSDKQTCHQHVDKIINQLKERA